VASYRKDPKKAIMEEKGGTLLREKVRSGGGLTFGKNSFLGGKTGRIKANK